MNDKNGGICLHCKTEICKLRHQNLEEFINENNIAFKMCNAN